MVLSEHCSTHSIATCDCYSTWPEAAALSAEARLKAAASTTSGHELSHTYSASYLHVDCMTGWGQLTACQLQ